MLSQLTLLLLATCGACGTRVRGEHRGRLPAPAAHIVPRRALRYVLERELRRLFLSVRPACRALHLLLPELEVRLVLPLAAVERVLDIPQLLRWQGSVRKHCAYLVPGRQPRRRQVLADLWGHRGQLEALLAQMLLLWLGGPVQSSWRALPDGLGGLSEASSRRESFHQLHTALASLDSLLVCRRAHELVRLGRWLDRGRRCGWTLFGDDKDLPCVWLSRDTPLQLECRLLLGGILLGYGLLVESEIALEELCCKHGLAVIVLR